MASVKIQNLSKSFERRAGSSIGVLDKMSIHAAHSEFICLLGPSGCGKSTVLNVLAQLIEPDSGEIYIDGEPNYRRHTFGYVFQQPRLLNWMTVRDNVRFPLRDRGLAAREIDRRAAHYLGLVGLKDFLEEYPLNLSGGMQQRVGIARALAIEPDVLLMDEPFSSLDELTARAMRVELLRIWQETKKTVFFVTHNPLESVFLADRIYVLSGRPSRVVREVTVDFARPRDADDPALAGLTKTVINTLLAN
jgi:NitT/TauT family transport system ATP-binding protein